MLSDDVDRLFAQRVGVLCTVYRISRFKLGQRVGMGRNGIYKMLKGERRVTIGEAAMLAKELRVDLYALIDTEKGWLP
jgi:transcriptional regulator with XRE-family HTH domain